jgi:hypothetical protein
MSQRATVHNTMRVYHRYLGFFLAGIMAIYALSGIVLIFRDTSFLKRKQVITKTLQPGMTAEQVGQSIRMRDLKFEPSADSTSAVQKFKQGVGTYNRQTGEVSYTITTLPRIIEKLTHLHKASTKDPLFYLNVFFAVSLFFFVLSSFWMFMPKTSIFKKGLIFTAAGIVLTLIMLLV